MRLVAGRSALSKSESVAELRPLRGHGCLRLDKLTLAACDIVLMLRYICLNTFMLCSNNAFQRLDNSAGQELESQIDLPACTLDEEE